ncbi:MAG TPA: hypothetical protein EYM50_03940, partial [Nitrososphaerales archaeon]|nr:hypothetical protein [Nitrososphaerales archaeon]
MANVNNFVASLQGGGARANQFRVSFPALGGGMEFLARSAQIPALTIGEIAVPYRGRQIFVPGDRTYDAWTLTVFNDTGFSIRSRLEGWANQIQNIGAVVDQSGFVYRDAQVEQLSRDGTSTLRTYNLFGVWPTTVDAIDLAWDTNDTIEEYGVTFRFNYMTIIPRTNSSNLRAGAGG